MIRSHIDSTRNCGVEIKLEEFSHRSDRSFRLGSPIELRYLSNILCKDNRRTDGSHPTYFFEVETRVNHVEKGGIQQQREPLNTKRSKGKREEEKKG